MNSEAARFREGVFYSVGFVFILWMIKSLENAMAIEFGFLGILPRTLSGTVGIITGPLVHGDVMHLLSNSFPLVFLGIGVIYFYNRIAKLVFLWIYLMTGIWVWIVAREAYHIGASGIVYGLVSFMFFSGLFRREPKSIAVSLIIIFLYSGMLAGPLPTSSGVSWESHILGAFAGIFCAFYFRKFPLQDSESIKKEDEGSEESSFAMYEIANFTHPSVEEGHYTYYFKPKEDFNNSQTPGQKPATFSYTTRVNDENQIF